MPGRDGTGPMGRRVLRGRGLGACTGVNAPYGSGPNRGVGCGWGVGLGLRSGGRRGTADYFAAAPTVLPGSTEWLTSQKEWLQSRLDAVSKQLGALPGDDK